MVLQTSTYFAELYWNINKDNEFSINISYQDEPNMLNKQTAFSEYTEFLSQNLDVLSRTRIFRRMTLRRGTVCRKKNVIFG